MLSDSFTVAVRYLGLSMPNAQNLISYWCTCNSARPNRIRNVIIKQAKSSLIITSGGCFEIDGVVSY